MVSGHQRPPNPEARPPTGPITTPTTTPITITIPFGDPTEGPKRCSGKVLPAPETVGTSTNYEIRAQLAVGGMGIVYWAWDHHLHRDVAVKLLRSERRLEKGLIDRFVNESQIMCRLQHPGIPPVYDSGFCADGRPYYAMKLVKGITLTELNRRRGWGKADILAIFVQVCHALEYAHCQGVAHLDVKPSNIMVGAFGEVYLMDWGLARFRGNKAAVGAFTRRAALSSDDRADAGSLGEFESIRGTPAYMPPEQAKGERVDARADIFGLGAILCEVLTGLPPYEGDSTRQVFGQATKAKTEAAFRRLDGAAVDPRLVRLTKRCLAASPGERPRSAGDVAKELQVYQEALLSRAEDDMQRFFELSLDLFCIAGLDGFFRRINANFSRVLGYSEEELLSRPFVDFVHEDDREETFRAMSMLARGESVVHFRNRYQTADGRYVNLEWTAKPFVGQELIYAAAREVSS